MEQLPQIAVSTGSLFFCGLERSFGLAKMAGFDAVEVLIDQRWDTQDSAYLTQLRDRFGLTIVALHSRFVPVNDQGEEDLGRLKESIDLAQKLKVPLVVVHVPLRFYLGQVFIPRLQKKPRRIIIPKLSEDAFAQFLRLELMDLERATGITVAVEHMPPYSRRDPFFMNTTRGLMQFRNLTLDTSHAGRRGEDPIALFGQFGSRVKHIHLSNNKGSTNHCVPWDGDMGLELFLQHVAASGYAGAISIETRPEALGGPRDENGIMSNLKRCREFCAQHLGL